MRKKYKVIIGSLSGIIFVVVMILVQIFQSSLRYEELDMDRIREMRGDELVEIFKGEWRVDEYLDWQVACTGEIIDEEYYRNMELHVKEVEEQYLGKVLSVNEDSIEYFASRNDSRYVYETWSYLFVAYRQPLAVAEVLQEPYVGAYIKIKDVDDSFDIIIDENRNAVIEIRGVFFKATCTAKSTGKSEIIEY